jgi:hypothetical protein
MGESMDEEEPSSVAQDWGTCVGVESKEPGMAHIDLCWLRNPKDSDRCLIRRDKSSSCLSCSRREEHKGFGACLRGKGLLNSLISSG